MVDREKTHTESLVGKIKTIPLLTQTEGLQKDDNWRLGKFQGKPFRLLVRKANKPSILRAELYRLWVDSETLGVPRPAHKHLHPIMKKFPNLDQTHTLPRRHMALRVFQARRRHCCPLGPVKCTRLFHLLRELKLSGAQLRAMHLNQAAQSQAQRRKEEARGLLLPTSIPQPHTWARWAGPRNEGRRQQPNPSFPG